MKSLIDRINTFLEYGTDQTDDYKVQRNIRFTNMGIWIGIVSISVFIIKNIYLSRYDAVFFEIFILLLLFGTWRINKKHYLTAVIVTLIMMELFFLACALFLFPGNRVELFFLFMAIIPHIFFFNTFWTATFFLGNMLLYFVPQLILHPYEDTITNYLVHISVFSAVFFIVRFFRLQMEGYETILTGQNDRLLQDKALIESQAAELKEIDQEKTHFFTNVSHEFRTPLTLISGMADQISEENSNILSVRGKDQLYKIKANVEKMSVMIDEILRLAKAGKAGYKLLLTPVQMKNFIGKHVDIFSTPAEESGICFQTDVAPEDLTLLVDESKFDQIMTNLLSNAIKYSPGGGCISLEVCEQNEGIIIKISDEGIGMKGGESEDVFERYHSTAEHYQLKGTGIGLAIARELVELHGGSISAHPNEQGKGATFVIELPAERKINPVETPHNFIDPDQDEAGSCKANILLAEDNSDMREYLSELLREQGYRVTTANGGNQTLKFIKEQPFDLLVTDYMMPDKDGYELAVAIKNDQDLKNIPIIFLTAKNDQQEKLKVLQLGVDDYILKPFNKNELLIRIENSLENSRGKNSFLLSDGVELKEPEDKILVRNFQKTVEEHVSDTQLKIPVIAEELAIEERSLYRKIKAITGLTPNEFIREIKLQYARELFENRSYTSFKEVAYAVGFETSFYFCKLYEKRFGKHPSEYL